MQKNEHDYATFRAFFDCIKGTFKNQQLIGDDAEFFKIAALFHDIGKCTEVDNHPQIGLYIVRDFFPHKTKPLIDILGTEYFALLCSVIQHHDKFGVVSTGEASLPLFADIPYYASNIDTIQGVKKNLSFVCLCNIIDIASSIPTKQARHPIKLKSDIVKLVSDDWNMLIKAVDDSGGERERLTEILLQQEYKAFRAINRIQRLIRSSTFFFPTLGNIVDNNYLQIKVPQVLQCNFTEFSHGLAHITKLDYGLRFFQRLVEGICQKKVEERDHDAFRKVPEKDRKEFIQAAINGMQRAELAPVLDEITMKILKIMERLVLRYRWILSAEARTQSPCRIGYEMRGVIGNEKLTSAIISNLLSPDSEPAVLNWITDKTPIWSFD